MPPKLKSKREKTNKKSKQQSCRQVKKPTRNWLDLPSDITLNILQRVGVIDILENAQKVCTAWRQACKDPAMWRVIYMDRFSGPYDGFVCREICKQAVDRSQGQLVDFTAIGFCTNRLLQYVADRSSQLRRLEVVYFVSNNFGICTEPFEKLSALEELSLERSIMPKDGIDAIFRFCPLLKSLKVNQEAYRLWRAEQDMITVQDEIAVAIGKNLPELTHLELIGNIMQNTGLQAILDGCSHLESLDLRWCPYLHLNGDLGRRCSQQIKHLRLPHEYVEWRPYSSGDHDVNRTLISLFMFG